MKFLFRYIELHAASRLHLVTMVNDKYCAEGLTPPPPPARIWPSHLFNTFSESTRFWQEFSDNTAV